jgi:hypothetical protein
MAFRARKTQPPDADTPLLKARGDPGVHKVMKERGGKLFASIDAPSLVTASKYFFVYAGSGTGNRNTVGHWLRKSPV